MIKFSIYLNRHVFVMKAARVLHNRSPLRPVPSVSRVRLKGSSFATAGTEHSPGRCTSVLVCISEPPRVIEVSS